MYGIMVCVSTKRRAKYALTSMRGRPRFDAMWAIRVASPVPWSVACSSQAGGLPADGRPQLSTRGSRRLGVVVHHLTQPLRRVIVAISLPPGLYDSACDRPSFGTAAPIANLEAVSFGLSLPGCSSCVWR
jgi:hypothetical protein